MNVLRFESGMARSPGELSPHQWNCELDHMIDRKHKWDKTRKSIVGCITMTKRGRIQSY